jgi:hypothetical protein
MSVRSLSSLGFGGIDMEGFHVSKPEDFAWLCLEYIKMLNASPIFEGSGLSSVDLRPSFLSTWKQADLGLPIKRPQVVTLSEPEPHKIMKMVSWEESVITDILLANAMIRLKAYEPDAPFQMMMHTTGGCPNGLMFSNGDYVGTGLSLIVDEKNQNCPYVELDKIFKEVIAEVKNGWLEATDEEREQASDFPRDRVTFRSKKSDYIMMVKKTSMYREVDLIQNISRRLGDYSIFSALWKGSKLPIVTDKIYTWVKKPEVV